MFMPGAYVFRDEDKYEIQHPLTFTFKEGTAFKTSPNSATEMYILKHDNRPSNLVATRGKYRIELNAGTKLKMVKLNADVVLNSKQEFILSNHTKMDVPIGTNFYIDGMVFSKVDDNPLYLSTSVSVADFLNLVVKA